MSPLLLLLLLTARTWIKVLCRCGEVVLLLLQLLLLHRRLLQYTAVARSSAAITLVGTDGGDLLCTLVVEAAVERVDPVDGQIAGPRRPRAGLLVPQEVVLEALVDGGLDPVRVVLSAPLRPVRVVVEPGVITAADAPAVAVAR
jgi:hypothetical protein